MRNIILALMVLLTIFCSSLIPNININSDMTEYLPSDSPMKEGLDSLHKHFPFIDTNAPTLRAMFSNLSNPDSLAVVLTKEDGVKQFVSMRRKDSLALYELVASDSTDLEALADRIKVKYPDCVAVETNANSNMPDNMVLILVIAALMIFVILIVMCSSFMETLLFIVTIGMAVVMNLGTNSWLPSVSMMTNTIVGVLQFVLSMDYSIILMNRYRMEKTLSANSEKAMSSAVRKSSSSILSSSLTTIVGLLVLVFMKFRIGMDLGVVLAKGVFLSLISIYTILPALILDFEKAIDRTAKKVPLIPTERLADFELRFRWVLCLLFFAMFITASILQNRTQLSYASVWESEISDVFSPQNSLLLLYKTDEEDKLIGIADSLKNDDCLVSAVSYPSIMKKKLSSQEMYESLGQLTSMLPPGDTIPLDASILSKENLDIVYYAITHPERKERMSFEDVMDCAQKAGKAGLLPDGMDLDKMMAMFTETNEPEVPVTVEPEPATIADTTMRQTTDSVVVELPAPIAELDDFLGSRFTRENCSAQLPASEMSEFLGMKLSDATTLYRMAGRKGKTMAPFEFIDFVYKNILPKPLLRKVISKEQMAGLEIASAQIDSAMRSVPAVEVTPEPVVAQASVPVDTVTVDILPVTTAPSDTSVMAVVEQEQTTPMDILVQMAMSGRKYGVDHLYSAVRAAGFPVEKDMLESMYMYYGSQTAYDRNERLSIEELVKYVGMGDMAQGGIGALRGDEWSMAAIVSSYPVESDSTFAFVDRIRSMTDNTLGKHYLIGESAMYKEMKDGFKEELLFLTLLTVLAIFLIVAISFRSVIIPAILIIAVLSGVFVNVFVSGVGGKPMLYLAYLIVQSILMGATIDYGILFTNFYLEARREGNEKLLSLRQAYKSSIHTIMTSGLIMVCAPYVMSLAMADPTISSILACLTTGALAAILVILLLLPATLAALDKRIIKKKG